MQQKGFDAPGGGGGDLAALMQGLGGAGGGDLGALMQGLEGADLGALMEQGAKMFEGMLEMPEVKQIMEDPALLRQALADNPMLDAVPGMREMFENLLESDEMRDPQKFKETMAAVEITPPPWVRKMQQVQAIRMHLSQQQPPEAPPPAANNDESEATAAASSSSAAAAPIMAAEWAHHLQARLPTGGHGLPAATLVDSSPLMAPPASASTTPLGLSGSLAAMGLGARKKRVTGKQLVAENRRLREEARRHQGAEKGGAAAARHV